MFFPHALNASAFKRKERYSGASGIIRIQGRVHESGIGIEGVAVSDGYNVVYTEEDGSYALVSNKRNRFVSISIPGGHEIPKNATGTARFYQDILKDGEEMTASFDLVRRETDPSNHGFVVLADPQTQDMFEIKRFQDETISDVKKTIAEIGNPNLFGLGCGDLMFDNLELFPEYEKGVLETGLPFYQVVGNHDIEFDTATDFGTNNTFCKHFGPPYYSFNVGEVHYVVLDDVLWYGDYYICHLDHEQYSWLAQDLSRLEPGSTVVVFTHIPVNGTRQERTGDDKTPNHTMTNDDALYDLLRPFEAHIISGHTHENEHIFKEGTHEHVHGAVCGAWWSGDLGQDGSPNGYGVYDIRGSEVKWSYKGTGREFSDQITLHREGRPEDLQDHFIANIWDWDPEWGVYWIEDGIRKGKMEQYLGFDPSIYAAFIGEQGPPRRPWVEPVPTNHLLRAPFDPKAKEIVVEAISRFGDTFTAKL